MSLVKSLFNLLKKNDVQTGLEATPENVCPNCWGRQEYGPKFFEAIKKQNINVNSKDETVGWIQDYANKHLSGIQLNEKNDYVCSKCKIAYRPSN